MRCERYLALPLGELAAQPPERETWLPLCLLLPFERACKALSVTFGDSSPRGRAKGLQLNHNDAGGEALSSLLLRPSPKACAGSAGYPALFDALLLRCNLPRDAETPAGQRNKTYSAWEE